MSRDYRDYISDILKAIQNIEEFTNGMSYDEFVRDEKTVWAKSEERRVGKECRL